MMRKSLIFILSIMISVVLATSTVIAEEDSIIRGTISTGSFTWNPQNFAGFYYDINDDLGTEQIEMKISDGNKFEESTGIIYSTKSQSKEFEFSDWGTYQIIGFMGNKYFSGYNTEGILSSESTDKNSLSNEQLEQILIDSDEEQVFASGRSLTLQEGYILGIKSIDLDGNKIYLELYKNGRLVDSKVVTSMDTYYYKNPVVGDQKELITIGVHFKEAFYSINQNLVSVDGIWQISEKPLKIKVDSQYGKMTITSVDATEGIIIMNNKDNTVTLSRNKDTKIMPGVNIKTADDEVFRFYIYQPINNSENGEVVLTLPSLSPVFTNNSSIKSIKKEPIKNQPGFESILALTGLIAIAFLVINKRGS